MSWRWRLVVDASVLLAIGSVVPTVPTADVVTAAQVLGPQGLGPVPFGVAKPNAVGGLIRVFGKPSSAGSNSGCDGRYSEVEWGELVAEFRLGVFSGYRYLTGGWPLTAPGFLTHRLHSSAALTSLLPKGSRSAARSGSYARLTTTSTSKASTSGRWPTDLSLSSMRHGSRNFPRARS
jgi:hypothetical protein